MNSFESDILVFNHHRRIKQGKFFYCVYTDDLINKLEISNIVIEDPINNTHRKPIANKNIIYTDSINLLVALKRKIIIKRVFSVEDEKSINHIIELINKEFSVDLDYSKVGGKLRSLIVNYRLMYPYYERLINRINPKLIIEVVSYGLSRFIINDIAHKKRIKTVELQHGTMGENHIAYNFKNSIELTTFPDYIFVFGQFWKDNTRLPISKENIKVTGWPYFENKINDYKMKTKKINKIKKTILFISQGTIGQELSQIAVDISTILDINEYRIIYKLHPGEYCRWKLDYPWLIDSNLEVIDHSQNDMHYYFAQSDIQVGVYSTALFEGLAYELETIIVKLYGYEAMASLYEKNIAYLAHNADAIIGLCKKGNSEIKYDLSYFWERNSIDKMISEINKIVNMRDQI
jgi:hypothetical protein